MENLKVTKSFIKDYKAGKISTFALTNNVIFQDWLWRSKDGMVMGLQGRIHSDNRATFEKAFGPPAHYFVGEFRNHNYYLKHDGLTILAHTAAGKGTGYELILDGKLAKMSFKDLITNKDLAKTFIDFTLEIAKVTSDRTPGKDTKAAGRVSETAKPLLGKTAGIDKKNDGGSSLNSNQPIPPIPLC